MTRYPRLCVKTADDSNNKHLMTCLKGNSEFCYPETLNVPAGEAEGNIVGRGVSNHIVLFANFPLKAKKKQALQVLGTNYF